MSLISREAAIKALTIPNVDALRTIQILPSVPAVPLDKLCEWLSESSINIPCTSCANFVNEYCTAIGDNSRPCPNSADDWRRAITEWMEEQQCASTDTEP